MDADTPSSATALREAAQAVAVLAEPGALLRLVVVNPDGTGDVYVDRRRGADPRLVARTCLAGLAAENRTRGPATFARRSLTDMRMAYGAVATLADPSTEMLRAWRAARDLIVAEWPAIEHVATRLRRDGRMTGAEVEIVRRTSLTAIAAEPARRYRRRRL